MSRKTLKYLNSLKKYRIFWDALSVCFLNFSDVKQRWNFYADAENIQEEFSMYLSAGKSDAPKAWMLIFEKKLHLCLYDKEPEFL